MEPQLIAHEFNRPTRCGRNHRWHRPANSNGYYAAIAGGVANTVLGAGGAVLGGAENYAGVDWSGIVTSALNR